MRFLTWLLGQLNAQALIAGASVYANSIDEVIATADLSIISDFDAPGHVSYTEDGYTTKPTSLADRGRLTTLLLNLYGSRKTGLDHTASTSGWRIEPGSDAKADLIASIEQGALVNRLSMGRPAVNGDFPARSRTASA